MKLTKKQNIKLAGEVIDLLRKAGAVEDNNPYAIENWAEDYLCNHSNLFETGKFKEE
jgi:hypothetical protein